MKTLIASLALSALCLVATSADPLPTAGYGYGGQGGYRGTSTYSGSGGYSNRGYSGTGGYGNRGYYGGLRGKRSADADPEPAAEALADPDAEPGLYYTYKNYRPYYGGLRPKRSADADPSRYVNYGNYGGYGSPRGNGGRYGYGSYW